MATNYVLCGDFYWVTIRKHSSWFMNFAHKASNQFNIDMATIIEYPVDEHAQIHWGDPMTTSWSILSSVFVDYNLNNANTFLKIF